MCVCYLCYPSVCLSCPSLSFLSVCLPPIYSLCSHYLFLFQPTYLKSLFLCLSPASWLNNCHFCLPVRFGHTLAPAVHKSISPPTCSLVQKQSASSSDLKALVDTRTNTLLSLSTHTQTATQTYTVTYQRHWWCSQTNLLAWLVLISL